jgi:hypothetical protein
MLIATLYASRPMKSLRRLEKIHREYGDARSAEKVALVRALDRAHLPSARAVLRLHEILLYLRAFPDDPAVLHAVERALTRFGARRDLVRFRGALAGSGIAGAELRYRFFWPMARWLAGRWPERLDYADELEPPLRAALPLLAGALEAEAIRRSERGTRSILDRLRGTRTAATWVVGRIGALPADEAVRESIHDAIDAPYVLAPERGAPSRTLAHRAVGPVCFSTSPPRRDRPNLARALGVPPVAVRRVSTVEGRRLIDLAREAMVTRNRDLDAFAWGNPRDVRLVEDAPGLAFVLVGVVPERRLPLPAVHGWLTLRNGVPTGYVQSDTLLYTSEIAFNTFETYRGTDAAHVFARVLAVARHLLGARSFSIEPYQLGHGNEEGLSSGAWWFYAHLGFVPKDAAVLRLHASERRRMRARAGHRSSPAVLERLATSHLYWNESPRAPALLPLVPQLGLRLPAAGRDPEEVAEQARRRFGVRSFSGWTRAERAAWVRLAPFLLALGPAPREGVIAAVRGKGAHDEDLSIEGWRKIRRQVSRGIMGAEETSWPT